MVLEHLETLRVSQHYKKMGKQIYLNKILALFKSSPVVDFKSLERIIGKSKNSSYAKLLVHNLLKEGKIKKIGKGVYTIHNEVSLAVFAYKPAYLGLQSALSHHGLWEQETIPVIITARRVRRGIREVMGGNILVRKTNPRYLFASSSMEEAGFYLPYSDVEKTFIDMVVFNQPMSKEVLQKISSRVDLKKLNSYLRKYPQKIKKRVTSLLSKARKK